MECFPENSMGHFLSFPNRQTTGNLARPSLTLTPGAHLLVSVATFPSAVASGFYQLYHFGPRLFIGSQFLKELTSLN